MKKRVLENERHRFHRQTQPVSSLLPPRLEAFFHPPHPVALYYTHHFPKTRPKSHEQQEQNKTHMLARHPATPYNNLFMGKCVLSPNHPPKDVLEDCRSGDTAHHFKDSHSVPPGPFGYLELL